METFELDWHERNLANSTDYESRMFDEIKRNLKSSLDRLNDLAYSNAVSNFQVTSAKHEGKDRYSEKYKLKLARTKFFRNKYCFEIKVNNAPQSKAEAEEQQATNASGH